MRDRRNRATEETGRNARSTDATASQVAREAIV
jgi:hypothetical protein